MTTTPMDNNPPRLTLAKLDELFDGMTQEHLAAIKEQSMSGNAVGWYELKDRLARHNPPQPAQPLTTTMDTPALLPCPFCGATDDDLSCDVDEYQRAYVRCGNCDTEGPVIGSSEIGSHAAIEQAIAAWNQRGAWQPIETAPRDGTEIIGLFPYNPRRKIVWFDGVIWRDYGSHGLIDPTHWQPLPSPPPITP